MLNEEALELAIKRAEFEDTWDQRSWASVPTANVETDDMGTSGEWVVEVDEISCGSTGCIAAHVVMDVGGKLVIDNWTYKHENAAGDMVFNIERCRRPDGQIIRIADYAQRVLGITLDEADRLFDGHNSLDKIKKVAEEIAEAHLNDDAA